MSSVNTPTREREEEEFFFARSPDAIYCMYTWHSIADGEREKTAVSALQY